MKSYPKSTRSTKAVELIPASEQKYQFFISHTHIMQPKQKVAM